MGLAINQIFVDSALEGPHVRLESSARWYFGVADASFCSGQSTDDMCDSLGMTYQYRLYFLHVYKNQKALILLYTATFFLMIHYGEGYHAWEVTPEDYSQILKWLYTNSIIYFPTAYFTKVTLLLLIGRVFAVKEQVARSIHVFIAMLFVAYLPVQIVKKVICIPIRGPFSGRQMPQLAQDFLLRLNSGHLH
ncbi:hypothetical protein V2G26_007111 [Clonostachys chloroleuca]